MALLEAIARPLDPEHPAIAHAWLLNERFTRLSTRDLLDEVIHREFAGRAALVSSFGAESVVLLHLAASVDPSLPVIFIDSGKMFGSTLRYRDAIVERLGLTDVRVARPDPAALAAHDTDSGLWLRDPDKCCAIRKVAPLTRALTDFDAWISGRKRYQGGRRTELPLAEADGDRIKVNPLARWSKEDVLAYRRRHDLPEHPLVADGFRSIGCMPCTTRVADGEDERDGRWRGADKTECGIHLGLPSLETDGSGI
jgi:phosphoadenosine phosphosulfate reductase